MRNMDRSSVCLTTVGAIQRSQILLDNCLDSARFGDSIQLNLHFLGAEDLECKNFNSSDDFMSSYLKLLEGVEQLGIQNLRMTFIGPNLLGYDPPLNQNTFLYHDMNVSVETHACLYHDYYSSQKKNGDFEAPDMVLMLNAGIWGYTSWLPTLDVFAQISIDCESSSSSRKYSGHAQSSGSDILIQTRGKAPIFIVTSYTIEEAEDDEDTISEYFKKKLIPPSIRQDLLKDPTVTEHSNQAVNTVDNEGALQPHWMWEAEISPFKCLEEVERHTKIEGREYRPNHAWQCFVFK